MYGLIDFNALKEVVALGFVNPTAKKFLWLNLSPQKKFLHLAGFMRKRPAKCRTKLPSCGHKKKFLHAHYFWAVRFVLR